MLEFPVVNAVKRSKSWTSGKTVNESERLIFKPLTKFYFNSAIKFSLGDICLYIFTEYNNWIILIIFCVSCWKQYFYLIGETKIDILFFIFQQPWSLKRFKLKLPNLVNIPSVLDRCSLEFRRQVSPEIMQIYIFEILFN